MISKNSNFKKIELTHPDFISISLAPGVHIVESHVPFAFFTTFLL